MMRALRPPSTRDQIEMLETARDDILRFRGAHFYVTGGTGFVGTWLLSAIVAANRELAANIFADVLTRDPQRVLRERPHLCADPNVRLIPGDVTAEASLARTYDVVVHAATPTSAAANAATPEHTLATIYEGGRHAIAVARHAGNVPLLFTSSGAVYGPQPPALEKMSEAYLGGPDPLLPYSTYAEGKRLGELQCALAARHGVSAKIARLFAFVGPYLPLDEHFAVGNFLRDALAGAPISVGGDGTPYRSYLYASDMAIALFAILARGDACRAYNVGSDAAISIRELALTVATQVHPASEVRIALPPNEGSPPARYVPDVARIATELGFRRRVELAEAVRRTARWHRGRDQSPEG